MAERSRSCCGQLPTISMPSGGGELRKTHMSETTRRKAGKVDSILASAVDIAREGLAPIAKPEEIGQHLEIGRAHV